MNARCNNTPGVLGFAAIALMTASQAAYAQAWPTKPIRMICAYAPGGSIDLTGRPVAQGLTELLGQQVVYENRPGANGNLGGAAVAKAASAMLERVCISISFSESCVPHVAHERPHGHRGNTLPAGRPSKIASGGNVFIEPCSGR